MTPKLWLIGLVLLTLAIYWPLRQAGFVYEDSVYLEPAQRPLGWAQLLAPRGLTLLSFRAQWLADGGVPRAAHALNLFLHLLCGLLVYAVSARLLTPPAALLASALFFVHPLQSETVAYLAGGRAELIAAVGILGVVWAFTGPVVTGRQVIVGILAAVAAVGGKELGVLALPLVALHAIWFRAWRGSWRLAGGLVMGAGVFLGLLVGVFHARILGNLYLTMTERGALAYAALQSLALWQYLGLAIWPVGLSVDHDVELASRGLTLVTLALTVSLASAVVWYRRRWPVVTFGGAWLLLALLPRFVVRQAEYLNEHQIYVALIGVWLALAANVQALSQWLQARAPEALCDSSSPSA